MKHGYFQFKRNVFLFLAASALLGEVSAQSDSLRSARTDGTLSVNGTVTYDGIGAGTSGSEGSYFGYNAGRVTTGESNSFFGANSGYSNTTGLRNTFIGSSSGYLNTTGYLNSFVGHLAGYSNSIGRQNTFIGSYAGTANTSGNFNVFVGEVLTGVANTTGSGNVFVGNSTGKTNTTGNNNTYIGALAGNKNLTGSNNVFLGVKAGMNSTESNKLIIANTETDTPLIYGDFNLKQLVFNGQIGIGTSTFPTSIGSANVSNYQLFVKGGVLSDEIRVRTGWADYVFSKDYKLTSLEEVKSYINDYGHLPNVPSANQIEIEGLDLGNISKIQMAKIEELTLYIIKQDEILRIQQSQINELKKILVDIKKE
jgi:hypothetical protein